MKIAFIGSREFCNKKFVEHRVVEYLMKDCIEHVSEEISNQLISGGAKGVDSWAVQS